MNINNIFSNLFFFFPIECNINLFERTLCGHDTFKERFEFYFSINQLNELTL